MKVTNVSADVAQRMAILFIMLCLSIVLFPTTASAEAVCANVKIEIAQELTLERQAFDAMMRINNGLDTVTLSDFDIHVTFQDETGNAVVATSDPNDTSAAFFIRIDSTDGVTGLTTDGARITSGSVAPKTTAEIHWLIIPSPGAGGDTPEGKFYFVGATLSYNMGGELETVETAPDFITVKPMPLLSLDYFLTEEVHADDAFTAEVEPAEPFSLGVRIQNNGAAAAQNMQIESAQPKIISNDQGLLINFLITGSYIDDQPAMPTLTLNFGDIEAGTAATGRWVMETTLSGTFVDFTASFTHADELGGAVTSLIDPEGIKTHLLVRDVRVDLPGRDMVRDFLAHDVDSTVLRVYESDSTDTVVSDQSAGATFVLDSQSGTGAIYTLNFTPTAGFAYVKLPDPYAGQKAIKSVIRADGKVIPLDNAWLSRTRNLDNPSTPTWDHYINFFDADTSGSYTVYMGDAEVANLAPVLVDIPPQSVIEQQALSFLVQASDPEGTTPVITADSLPIGATLTDHGNGTATFDWMPSSGQAGEFNITFKASDGELTDTTSAVVTVNSLVDTDGDGMANDWELLYFGTLDRDGTGDFDGDGISDFQEYLDGTDPTVPAASAPTNIAAVPGSEQNTISWDTVTGATVYNLYWSTVPGVTKATGNLISDVSSSYVHLGLDNNQPYYYVVTAYHSGGESVESVEVSATPGLRSWGTPLMLESNDNGDAAMPQVAMDAFGNGLAVWEQSDGTVSSIWADTYTVDIGWSGVPVLLESDDTGDARMPVIAMGTDGNAMAVWLQSDGMRDNVMAARYIAGTGWGAPVQIETNDTGPAYRPLVDIDDAGNVLAVWTHSNGTALPDGSWPGNEVWGNRFDVSAGSWGTASAIENNVTVYASASGFEVNPDGNAMVVWSESDDGVVYNLISARYLPGSGWQAPETVRSAVSGASDSPAVVPSLALDGTGNAIVAWTESNSLSTNVWTRRYEPVTGWQAAQYIETNDAGNAYLPQAAIDNVGNALVMWSHSDGAKTNVWSNYFDSLTGIWSGAVQADIGNSGAGSLPRPVFTPNGDALAVWQQRDLIGENIWAGRYVPGAGWDTAQIIETENLGDARHPQLAVNGTGDALAVWQQSNGTVTNIWANSYLVDNVGVPNIPPIAWTGSDLSVDEGGQGNLSGEASFDQDGNVVSYSWIQTGGPSVSLSDPGSATPVFTAPLVYQEETLTFELTVTDDSGLTGQRSVNVTVLNINSDDDADGLDDAWEMQYFGNFAQDGVTDFDGDGISDLNEYLQGSTPTLLTPAVPSGVSAQPAIGQVTLSWQPDAVATSYNIYWSTEPGVTPATGTLITATGSTYVHTGLSTETTYYYVISAVAEEASSVSLEVSATAGRYAWEVASALPADANYVSSEALSGGTVVSVWANASGNIMSALYSDSSGWGVAEMVDSGTGGAEKMVLAGDGLGNAIAVWQQSDVSGDNIWANHYNTATGWSTPEVIQFGILPKGKLGIAMDESGNAVVAWRQADGFWANRYTDGSGWGTAELLMSFPDFYGYYSDTAVAMNGSGSAVIAWEHYDINNFRRTAHSIGYIAGTGWGTVETVGDIATGYLQNMYTPSVAMDAASNIMLAWSDSQKLMASWYSPGNGWQMTELASEEQYYLFIDDHPPALAMSAEGAIVAWSQIFYYGAQEMQGVQVVEYRFDSGWGMPELVTSKDASASNISIRVNGNGKITLAFADYPAPPSFMSNAWAVMHDPDSGWGVPQLLGKVNSWDRQVNISQGENSDTIALWIDQSKEIAASRYRLFDSPPIADTGSPQTVYGGQSVSLDAGASTDIDGVIQSYNWTGANFESWALASAPQGSASEPVWSIDTATSDSRYYLKYALTVTDNDGAMVTGMTTVTLLESDTDQDGLDDLWELQYFGELNLSDESSDFDGDGFADWYELEQGTDPTLLTPGAPQNIALQAGVGEMTLTWDPVPGAVAYNIYWGYQTGVDRSTGTLIANVGSPYLHTNLEVGSSYYYVVTAVGADESVESAEVSAIAGQLAWSASVSIHTDAGLAEEAKPALAAGGDRAVAVWEQSGNIQAAISNSGIWGTAELLETSNKDARNPKVAMNDSGVAVAVWEQVSPSSYSILASHYDPVTGWSDAELLESGSENALNPAVVIDSSGYATAVWQQFDGSTYSVFANHYTPGTGWGAAQLVENLSMAAFNPVNIAVDGLGNAMAVWEVSDGNYEYIYAVRYDSLSGWGAPEQISFDQVAANTPDITADAAGNFIAVWDSHSVDRESLTYARYTPAGGWDRSYQLTLAALSGIEVANPSVQMDDNGNVLVAWTENGETMATHFKAETAYSGYLSPKITLSANGAVVATSKPALVMDQNGDGVTVWEETDGAVTSLWYSQYDNLSGWGAPARFESEAQSAYAPTLAVQGNGMVLAAWAQAVDPDFSIQLKMLSEVNVPPNADADADQTVYGGQLVTLNASLSSDSDGIISAYHWTQMSGPEVVLSDATSQNPTFTAPLVDVSTQLVFSLTVTDDQGATAGDTVAVTVLAPN